MRPHGKADINPNRPRALGICDKCGSMYNHDALRWQYQWGGPQLINLRMLVCDTCYDTPQAQLRLLILPPDPVPIQYPRPENYVVSDDPPSYLGFDARHLTQDKPGSLGMNIGSMVQGGGVDRAFDAVLSKPLMWCAQTVVSNSSFNTVGKNWSGDISGITTPSSLAPPVQQHTASGFDIYGPRDAPILRGSSVATVYFQGSNDGGAWTTLYSTTTAGTNGEHITSISSNLTSGPYSYHRLSIVGDGATTVAVAQLLIHISDAGQNEQ